MELFVGVLGPFVARDGDRQFDRLPRKARGLLAYLATRCGEHVSREYLGDLLWPDRELGLGLHGVRNSLGAIRAALGKAGCHYISTGSRSVQLAGAAVDLDLLERLGGSDQLDQLQRAALLYRGDFLADLSIESEPFEHWVATERSRVRSIATGTLRRLVAAHDRVGQHAGAIRSAERLIAIDQLSEHDHRLLMIAYARAGRRADALRQYRCCIELLRDELGVEPERETRDLYAEIKGPEFAKRADRQPGQLSAVTSPKVGPAPRTWPHLAPKLVVGLEPICNLTGDQSRDLVAERMTEDLVTDLLRGVGGLVIVRDNRGGSFASLLHAARPEINYILTATAQPAGNKRLRINVHLTEVETAAVRWGHRFEHDIELLSVEQTRLTEEIARSVQLALVVESVRRSLSNDEELPTLDDYLARARAALGGQSTPITTNDAQRWLLGALAVDAHNVDALTTLARTCHHVASQPGWSDDTVSRTAFEIGRKAAASALEIAPANADAHCFLGMLYSTCGDLEMAREALDRAILADPDVAIAHAFGGYNAAFLGEADKTLPAVERAMQIGGEDRRQAVWWFFAGFAELLLGRSETAISFLTRSLDRNPGYGSAQLFLAAALQQSGRVTEAEQTIAAFRRNFQGYQQGDFIAQWLSRSRSAVYRVQIDPVFEQLRELGLGR